MSKTALMRAQDAISAKLAECFVTIEGKRYNFMQMIDFEAKVEKNKNEIPILGQTGAGNKGAGWSGTFSGTAHYNQSILRGLLLRYKKTGEDVYFDIQVSNYDPTSAAGKQTIIHISLIQQYLAASRNFFEIPIDLIIIFDGNAKACHISSDFLGHNRWTHIPGAFLLRHGQEG